MDSVYEYLHCFPAPKWAGVRPDIVPASAPGHPEAGAIIVHQMMTNDDKFGNVTWNLFGNFNS